jgi:hypothetical protein
VPPENAPDGVADPEPWEKLVSYPKLPKECTDLLGTECHWKCVRYAATCLPAVARKSIDCLRRAMGTHPDDPLICVDPCTTSTCTAEGLAGLRGSGDRRCEGEVRNALKVANPDPSYVSEMVTQCQAYTSGMNEPGRNRFIACVLANPAMGFRVCLWDPSVAPCGHDAAHTAHDLDE